MPDLLKLFCLVEGDDPKRTFPVEISKEATVGDLKNSIKDRKRPAFDQIAADVLDLWKLRDPLPARTIGTFKGLVHGPGISNAILLEPLEMLSAHFDNSLLPGRLHLIVQVFSPSLVIDDRGTKRKHIVEFMGTDIDSKRSRYIQEQDKNAAVAQVKVLSPSVAAQFSNFESEQAHARIYNDRPFHISGSPISLFHPAFDVFDELESNSPILPDIDLSLNVRNYIELSRAVYLSEALRMDAIRPVLEKLLGAGLNVIDVGGARSNGFILVPMGSWSFYSLIFVLKNEVGAGGTDPYFQCSFAYQKYWSSQSKVDTRRKSYCPSILLAIAGPWLCIGGAVYAEVPITAPLTDYMYTGNDSRQTRLERVFYFLRRAITSLWSYYEALPSSTAEGPLGYPYISDYDGTTFSYDGMAYCDNMEKLVFRAREGNNFRVVKFATQYNEVAHRILAEDRNGESFAPILRHVSSRLYGGRRMIVMDYVEGEMLDGKLTLVQYDQIKRALDRLHEEGLVFGDLRGPNVIIKGDRAMLVDFDWCGKDGEAKYPIGINTFDIHWVDGVGPGLHMKKEHDRAMLEKLRPDV